jgi:hypothetical protein
MNRLNEAIATVFGNALRGGARAEPNKPSMISLQQMFGGETTNALVVNMHRRHAETTVVSTKDHCWLKAGLPTYKAVDV